MRSEIILTLVGMAVVTYFTRSLFILALRQEILSPFLLRWLRFVPVAVLSSIIAPMIAAPHGALEVTYDSPYLLAGILTACLAGLTKNLIVTVIGGMTFILLLKFMLG
jgi:branched-subunit amino acid transport protein